MTAQAKKLTSISPISQDESPAPKDLKIGITAHFGSNGGPFKVMPGQTVEQVFGSEEVRTVTGHTTVADNNTRYAVNGELVEPGYIVQAGDECELLKRLGEKAYRKSV